VTTDSDPAKPAIPVNPEPETPSCEENAKTAKPTNEVTTDLARHLPEAKGLLPIRSDLPVPANRIAS